MAHILIVEDDASISGLMLRTLKSEGYQCVLASDGREGADWIEKGGFDLVLLD
ncbi:MAG: response regulator, partial [Erysipelotrichaceae bacterium]|nr:response regulator [Erysipelotrichaceae bacterium]